ncbi:hypothetical protein [Nocardioides pinisoli]|uniref:PhiRv1 phage protein n=1 Tax=Nocardioides pinisoli TaxID=2950279 RepID=A0ABT1L1N7_9ACTN|nr:hypothetical protein [Nocardioides pinisoli]MCP3422736.1 hypothetical protein [Nocardioides pinisoli]
MSTQDPVVLKRAAVARAVKAGNAADVLDARRDYAAEKLAAYIQRTVDEAPPLTDEQRARLTHLLRPTAGGGS